MFIHDVAFADHIFDMNVTNNNVFSTVVKPIVDAAVNGFNGTVFAYGQTSSGKTYTMMGIPEELGIIPLAIDHMFDAIAKTPGREFLLRLLYFFGQKILNVVSARRSVKYKGTAKGYRFR